MIVFLGLVTLFYCLTILFLLFGFTKLKASPEPRPRPDTAFSVVIPYRNEARHLPTLLDSLENLEYPPELFEIILVNDASEDASLNICRNFKHQNPHLFIELRESVRLSKAPKKDAINTAVGLARHPYILTTDADCRVPGQWLRLLDSQIKNTGAKMIVGPVTTEGKGHAFVHLFQEIDILSLQAATMGGFGAGFPFMCNGANLCYEKDSFRKVEGFRGNEEIASGDDMFLLEKFSQHQFKTVYLKNPSAIVTTRSQPTWNDLLSQRVRWAAKAPALKNPFGRLLALLVLLMNFSLAIGFFLFLTGGLSGQVFFLCFLAKFNVDFILLYRTSDFFGKNDILENYFWSSFLYPVFTSTVGFYSLFSGFRWKGRQFKK